MLRPTAISFCAALLAFVLLDLLLHFAAVLLDQSDMPRISAIVGQFFLPFAPIIVAGLIAGYIGTPRGFIAGLVTGMVGGLVSILWRYHQVPLGPVAMSPVYVSIVSWVLGTAVATGICGLAGERIHAKRTAA